MKPEDEQQWASALVGGHAVPHLSHPLGGHCIFSSSSFSFSASVFESSLQTSFPFFLSQHSFVASNPPNLASQCHFELPTQPNLLQQGALSAGGHGFPHLDHSAGGH